MVSDMARISAVEATVSKVRRVDERRKWLKQSKKRTDASYLRKPGKGTEPEETEDDKKRFVEPLAQLMMDCKVGRAENVSASDEEMLISLRRQREWLRQPRYRPCTEESPQQMS